MSQDDSKLRDVIRKINEDLGKHRVKNFKGGGSSQGNYVHAERKGLGELDPFGVDEKPKKKSTKLRAVKVSKAFLDLDVVDNSSQEIYTEDEPKKLNEGSDDKGVAWDRGFIYKMSDIRGTQSLTPYSGNSQDFWFITQDERRADAVASIVNNPNIIWREGDPYMYRFTSNVPFPIQVIAGPSKKNVGKKFSINSQTAKNLAKDRYTSQPSRGSHSMSGDDGHTQLKAALVSAGSQEKRPKSKKITTKNPEDEWVQEGDVKIDVSPVRDKREQIVSIVFPTGTGKEVTLQHVKGAVEKGSHIWEGTYTNSLLLELEDAKFDPIADEAGDQAAHVVKRVDINKAFKKSSFEDDPKVLSWFQTITIKLNGPGKYAIHWDKKASDDTISIIFQSNKILPDIQTGDKDKSQKVYKGSSANVWRVKVAGKKRLDKDMKGVSAALGAVRLGGRPWKRGVKNIKIITSDSKPPSTATNNIIRYEFDGIEIPNPKFAGKFGNRKRAIPIHYVAASRWLIINDYLSFNKLVPVKNSKRYKPKTLKEAIQDLDVGGIGGSSTAGDVSGGTSGIESLSFRSDGVTATSPEHSTTTDTTDSTTTDTTDDFDSDDYDKKLSDEPIDIDTDIKTRALKISAATGIKPEAIYGIEMTESSGNPRGLAFNDQIFRRELNTKEEHDLADKLGIAKGKGASPRYRGNAAVTFEKAYQINPEAAIKAGAWGLYQVLGGTSLPLYGNDPETFLAAFNSNPMDHSVKSFIRWVKNRGNSFVNAINNDKHTAWVKMYYGPAAFSKQGAGKPGGYVERYVTAKNKWSNA